MTVLVVACKGCGAPVATGIRTGKVADPLLGPHTFRCAACGFAGSYHGREFTAAPAARLPAAALAHRGEGAAAGA